MIIFLAYACNKDHPWQLQLEKYLLHNKIFCQPKVLSSVFLFSASSVRSYVCGVSVALLFPRLGITIKLHYLEDMLTEQSVTATAFCHGRKIHTWKNICKFTTMSFLSVHHVVSRWDTIFCWGIEGMAAFTTENNPEAVNMPLFLVLLEGIKQTWIDLAAVLWPLSGTFKPGASSWSSLSPLQGYS